MLYLLDANVLIRADEEYYGFDLVPQFWDWLLVQCEASLVKMPLEIWQEVCGSRTQLGQWINDKNVKAALILDEEADNNLLNDVLARGYGPNLTDTELEKIGQDMFLIAYARAAADRIVVTKEVSAPSNSGLTARSLTSAIRWVRTGSRILISIVSFVSKLNVTALCLKSGPRSIAPRPPGAGPGR